MLLKELIEKLVEVSHLNPKWLNKEVYVEGQTSIPELSVKLITKTDQFIDDHIIISES